MRAPRKFTDSTRSEITPEWQAWHREQMSRHGERLEAHVRFLGDLPEDRWPERYGKDVGEGCWVFVVDEPHTEMRQRFRVPTPSLWWARPEVNRPGGMQSQGVSIPGPYRVVIETPGGSLWLFPREYVICEDPVPLITDPECTIHRLGGNVPLDDEKGEQIWYLQSRGWSREDALLAVMDGVDMRDWGWVEFPEYARAMFEGVGRRRVFA